MGYFEQLTRIPAPEPQMLLEIFALSAIFYYIILFIRGTRGAAILSGFAKLDEQLVILLDINALLSPERLQHNRRSHTPITPPAI